MSVWTFPSERGLLYFRFRELQSWLANDRKRLLEVLVVPQLIIDPKKGVEFRFLNDTEDTFCLRVEGTLIVLEKVAGDDSETENRFFSWLEQYGCKRVEP